MSDEQTKIDVAIAACRAAIKTRLTVKGYMCEADVESAVLRRCACDLRAVQNDLATCRKAQRGE